MHGSLSKWGERVKKKGMTKMQLAEPAPIICYRPSQGVKFQTSYVARAPTRCSCLIPGGNGGVARLNVFTRGPRMFVLRASASRAKRTSDAEAIFVCSE